MFTQVTNDNVEWLMKTLFAVFILCKLFYYIIVHLYTLNKIIMYMDQLHQLIKTKHTYIYTYIYICTKS